MTHSSAPERHVPGRLQALVFHLNRIERQPQLAILALASGVPVRRHPRLSPAGATAATCVLPSPDPSALRTVLQPSVPACAAC